MMYIFEGDERKCIKILFYFKKGTKLGREGKEEG